MIALQSPCDFPHHISHSVIVTFSPIANDRLHFYPFIEPDLCITVANDILHIIKQITTYKHYYRHIMYTDTIYQIIWSGSNDNSTTVINCVNLFTYILSYSYIHLPNSFIIIGWLFIVLFHELPCTYTSLSIVFVWTWFIKFQCHT